MNERILVRACKAGDRVVFEKLGVPRHDSARNLLQLIGIQRINWSKAFYKIRKRWYKKSIGRLPYRYKRTREFFFVWIFIL